MSNALIATVDNIQYILASQAQDVADAAALRYQVLVEEFQYLPKNREKIISDMYDLFADTSIILAVDEGRIIGTLRIVRSQDPNPAKEYFNFSQFVMDGRTIYDLNRLVVLKEYRKKNVAYYLLVIANQLIKREADDAVISIVTNPDAQSLFKRVGYKKIGQIETCEKSNLPFIPFLSSVNEVTLDLDVIRA